MIRVLIPARAVTVYHAPECGLCAHAIDAARVVCAELGHELSLVDISGSDDLERRFRVLLPVVEVDGEVAFTLAVDADELRDRLA